MRLFHARVFDDVIGGTNPAYVSASLSDLLGQSDSFHVFIVTSQVTGASPTLSVALETSPDQIMWTLLQNLVVGQSLNVGTLTNVQAFKMPDPFASYYVRLRFTLGGTTPRAHVKAWVTGRADIVLREASSGGSTAPKL